jgi:hypothetical protein
MGFFVFCYLFNFVNFNFSQNISLPDKICAMSLWMNLRFTMNLRGWLYGESLARAEISSRLHDVWRTIWMKVCIQNNEPLLLFKLCSSFKHVNIRAAISPCNQSLIRIYISVIREKTAIGEWSPQQSYLPFRSVKSMIIAFLILNFLIYIFICRVVYS